MPYVSGYISVEVDVADYDYNISVEFSDIADVIEAAENGHYTKMEIVDYCFEEGLDITKYLRDTLDVETAMELFKQAIDRKVNYFEALENSLQESIDYKDKLIAELKAKVTALESPEDTMSDAEAIKNVAY